MSLEGRTAIVTGGASGIGRAIVDRLAKDGAAIGILDLDAAGAERTANELRDQGRRAFGVAADVSSFGEMERAIGKVRSALGPIGILVNNAGHGELAPLAEMTEEQWDRMIAVHLKGCFNGTRAVLQDMMAASWGRIVSTSSVAGLSGMPGFVHYSAAKAGIVGFTKALAQEIGRFGITVNAIAPGVIDTPIFKGLSLKEGAVQKLIRSSAMKRAGLPEDIAAACGYIVSEEASFLTGQTISPNGGIHF